MISVGLVAALPALDAVVAAHRPPARRGQRHGRVRDLDRVHHGIVGRRLRVRARREVGLPAGQRHGHERGRAGGGEAGREQRGPSPEARRRRGARLGKDPPQHRLGRAGAKSAAGSAMRSSSRTLVMSWTPGLVVNKGRRRPGGAPAVDGRARPGRRTSPAGRRGHARRRRSTSRPRRRAAAPRGRAPARAAGSWDAGRRRASALRSRGCSVRAVREGGRAARPERPPATGPSSLGALLADRRSASGERRRRGRRLRTTR